jgi:hypothetical protein
MILLSRFAYTRAAFEVAVVGLSIHSLGHVSSSRMQIRENRGWITEMKTPLTSVGARYEIPRRDGRTMSGVYSVRRLMVAEATLSLLEPAH